MKSLEAEWESVRYVFQRRYVYRTQRMKTLRNEGMLKKRVLPGSIREERRSKPRGAGSSEFRWAQARDLGTARFCFVVVVVVPRASLRVRKPSTRPQ